MEERSSDADSPILISALQHYLYCPRQCALIHLEQIWTEDGATAEGRILHERVDQGRPERRGKVRIVRNLTLTSRTHGLIGKADAVELTDDAAEPPFPIEYKRGRPKAHRADEVQLCAQALCLEEMLGQPVPAGALFYGQTRRRQNVAFDAELRSLTVRVAQDLRAMLASGLTPAPPDPLPPCKRCSLESACRPQAVAAARRVDRWLDRQLAD
jgi:CRISPR-associated exonuclease Cas4